VATGSDDYGEYDFSRGYGRLRIYGT